MRPIRGGTSGSNSPTLPMRGAATTDIAERTCSGTAVRTSKTPLTRPSRSTTTRSATATTSSRSCETITMLIPRARSCRIMWSTMARCSTPSAAVGSSNTTRLGSPSSERAMATICRSAPVRSAILASMRNGPG